MLNGDRLKRLLISGLVGGLGLLWFIDKVAAVIPAPLILVNQGVNQGVNPGRSGA